jgi:hypothetical protein
MVQGEEVQLCLFAPSRSNGSVNEQTRTGPCRDTTGECDCACLYGKGTAAALRCVPFHDEGTGTFFSAAS